MTGSVYIGNRAGIPVITTTPVVGTSNVLITLPNHIFRFLGQKGKITINFNSVKMKFHKYIHLWPLIDCYNILCLNLFH